MIARIRSGRRTGATTVEVSVVLSVFLLFLFGIFEYCRYLMMIQITTNAARDGARYAVVNLGKGASFATADYNDGVKTYLSIQKFVDFLQVCRCPAAILWSPKQWHDWPFEGEHLENRSPHSVRRQSLVLFGT